MLDVLFNVMEELKHLEDEHDFEPEIKRRRNSYEHGAEFQSYDEENLCASLERELLKKFREERDAKRSVRSEDDIIVDGWDFAGQRIYYFTHHIYFSEKCTYLLLFDLTKGLHEEVNDESLENGYSRKSTELGRM